MNDDDKPSQSDQAAVDALDDALADPAVWAQPPAALQEQIVAAIADAKGQSRLRGRSRAGWYAIAGTAAAVLIAAGVVLGFQLTGGTAAVQYAAPLSGTPLAPHASGKVTLTKTTSGWKIHLHAEGLPRRADGSYYEAWLKSADGILVPVGTFNSFEDVTLWAGVPPSSHPTFTITRQLADGNPASTGQVVLSGLTERAD